MPPSLNQCTHLSSNNHAKCPQQSHNPTKYSALPRTGIPPTPTPSPAHFQQPTSQFVTCLVIPIRLPLPHHLDTNNNPPPQGRHLHHLANLYKAFQNNPSKYSGVTLIWLNLLRGILNNSSWVTTWSYLMNSALLNSTQNERARIAMNQLSNSPGPSIQLVPSTPLPTSQQYDQRTPPCPKPNSHRNMYTGNNIKMKGDQPLATTLTPHPLLAQMHACITYSLNLATRNIDY